MDGMRSSSQPKRADSPNLNCNWSQAQRVGLNCVSARESTPKWVPNSKWEATRFVQPPAGRVSSLQTRRTSA